MIAIGAADVALVGIVAGGGAAVYAAGAVLVGAGGGAGTTATAAAAGGGVGAAIILGIVGVVAGEVSVVLTCVKCGLLTNCSCQGNRGIQLQNMLYMMKTRYRCQSRLQHR